MQPFDLPTVQQSNNSTNQQINKSTTVQAEIWQTIFI